MDVESLKKSLKVVVEDAVLKGEFTLSSGQKSTYYIDGKMVSLTQKGAHLSAQVLFSMIQVMEISAIGGPSVGANPLVSTLGHVCFERGKPLKMFYVRRHEREHGTEKWIEGPPIGEDDKVVIIEDVITTGGSAIHTANKVRETGAKVDTVFCLVDRQAGGTENLKKEGLELRPIFTAAELGLG